MEPYKDISGKSGVIAYEIGKEHIDIQFVGGARYRYDYGVPGRMNVDMMKTLAQSGEDLATYINKTVRKRFALKLP